MALNEVKICNTALTMLSSATIDSLGENSQNARKCNILYEDTRDAMLYEHNWNFSRTQATLSQSTTTIHTADYDFVYPLPNDPFCLRVLRLDQDFPFAIFGRNIYTNSDVVAIEYIARITDAAQFSYGFAKALSARLALELAYGITQSQTVFNNQVQIFKIALSEAKWADAQEGLGLPNLSGTFINSRQK